ncbi:hypothetical protein AAFF_G00265800 [Aldrovandia affinis]|uniref:G-protein coupled receptors family 1 profile domain-containing protein n=1 Tax=Aldrovandia affinis TaxID=143900 RepID=A0AAD7RC17_9TELE|nr:hypothetical protein AAFF_G00265800 [Aldrovandia affinis]
MSLQKSAAFQTALNDNQIKTLSIVYISSLSLSLLGSFSVVVVTIIKRRHLNEQVRPLLQLALADFLASAVLLCTSAINFIPYGQLPQSISICERGLPLALMFYGISFLLVMVYAYESKRAVQGWRERTEEGGDRQPQSEGRDREKLPRVYAVVWFVPIGVYFLYVFTEGLTEANLQANPGETMPNEAMTNKHMTFCTSCILLLHFGNDSCPHVDEGHDLFVKSFFFVSVLSVLLCCNVVYYKVGSWYSQHQERGMFLIEGDRFGRRRLRDLYSTARSMVLVIIFCWTPAFILVSLSFTEGIPQEKLYPLYVIQAVTVSLQGLLDSAVYGWLRRNFREAALGERMPLLATPTKAYYDESLTATR